MAAERGPGGPLVNGASTEPRAAFSAATQLPPGAEAFGSRPVAREWIEITDPQTQLTFYADPVTGECRWDKPEDGRLRRKDPAGEWWELYDDNHKLPYYYNANSGQTEWLRPTTGSIIPLALIQSSALGKRVSVALRHSFDELKLPVRSSVSLHDGNSPQPDIHDISMEPNQHLRGRTLFKTAADGRHDSSRNPSSSDKAAGIPEDAGWLHLEQSQKSIVMSEVERKGGVIEPVAKEEAALQMSQVKQTDRVSGVYSESEPNRSSLKSLPPELQQHINQFQIDGFAKKYFSTHKQGLFRRKVPVEKMLNWTKDSLKQPLIVLNKSVHKDALKCFKSMQRFMGDRPPKSNNGSAATEEIQWILTRGILHGELRDEIYVQLCKQLTNNPSSTSVRNGWELMCVILITFPPSKNFENYLQCFLRQNASAHSGETVSQLANYAVSRLRRICKVGPRGKVPTAAEIDRGREAAFKPSVFGESLEDIMRAQRQQYPDLPLPRVVPFLADAILKHGGLTTEGIFRVPGDADEVIELKVRLENGNYDLSGIQDPNVSASLLKLWLRDLAEPLIPEQYYEDCLKSAEDVPRAVSIVANLPELNKRVLYYIINFLQLFAKPETISVTKMNVGNLGMVMAPNFLRCPSENLAVVFENTKFEQAFMRILILYLRTTP